MDKPSALLGDKKSQFVIILLLLVLLSGVGVSYTTYKSRQLHNVMEAELDKKNQAQMEWGRLLLEYSTLAAPTRVETLARVKLGMQRPTVVNTIMVKK